jgi:hexosaminidase
MYKLISKLFLIFVCGTISAQSYNFVPLPVDVKPAEGAFGLNRSTVISAIGKESRQTALYLREKLCGSTGMTLKLASSPAKDAIVLSINSSLGLPAEGYLLTVGENRVTIEGQDADGLFYGVQTLLQLLPSQVYASALQGNVNWAVPAVTVKDYPRFHYRGMMLDVSRQFFDMPTVEKYIDWLSMHKINKFHMHLSDDQGWRIEIKKYPKLTSVGAWRGPGEALEPSFGSDEKHYGGFYSQKQIRELVRYAAERHVEIIPEIDLPGHSRAVVAAYPEIACQTDKGDMAQGEGRNTWCVGNEHTYAMLDDILKEIAALFPSKIIHIGGDEVNLTVWQHCPVCSALMKKQGMTRPEELQNYFVRRLEGDIKKLGKHMAGWDEIVDGGGVDPKTTIYAWRSVQKGLGAINKNLTTIMMVGEYYYFDMAQSAFDRGHDWAGLIPLRKVYSFDPADSTRFDAAHTQMVAGVQGAIWSELLNEPARFLEYQTFPRVCALAEAGWTPQGLRNWDDFYTRLTSAHFERLYNMGVAFRIPTPEVTYANGMATAVLPYPGADVRYTTDGSEPTPQSARYTSPVKVFDFGNLRFRTFYKDRQSVTVTAADALLGTWKSAADKPLTQEWNLAPLLDRPGIWYATFESKKRTQALPSIQLRVLQENTVIAADERRSGSGRYDLHFRLPVVAFDASKSYRLQASIQSNDSLDGSVRFDYSPYQEPVTGISTDMNLVGDNVRWLTDYDFGTSIRTRDRGQAGQSLTFVFLSPVTCSKITSFTGLPFTRIYPLKKGHLEISYDGSVFEKCAVFEKGTAVATPTRPVKAVKIVIDAPNYDYTIAIQDLRIE